MDFNKLSEFSQGQIFTDLTLVFTDDTSTDIRMNVHKIIMCVISKYFEKLLTNFQEKDMNTITLSIPGIHALTMYAIIASMYRQKIDISDLSEWQYQLESIICRDFWDLAETTDLSKLFDLNIPQEGFALLLRAVDASLAPINSQIQLIQKNLPDKFDLKQLPPKFSDILPSINPKLAVIIGHSDEQIVIVRNILTNKLICSFDNMYESGRRAHNKMCYSPVNSSLACLGDQCQLLIFNVSTKSLVINKPNWCSATYVQIMFYSPDGNYLITSHEKSGYRVSVIAPAIIRITETTKYTTIRTIELFEPFDIYFTPDSQNLLVMTYEFPGDRTLRIINCTDPNKSITHKINKPVDDTFCVNNFCTNGDMSMYAYGLLNLIIGDLKSETVLDSSEIEGRIKCICFSPNGKQIAYIRNNLHIIDLDTKDIKTIQLSIGIRSIHINYSPDGAQIAIADNDTVGLYHVNTGRLIWTYEHNESFIYGLFLVHL